MIRDAAHADAGAIAAIWNHYIQHTTVTFNPVEKTEAEIAAMTGGPDAFLVWEDAGKVAGFARYFPFRSGQGYRFSVEHTILLAPGGTARGGGRALITEIAARAKAAGKHSLIAGVSGENAAGRGFHTAMGFASIATLPEVGWKFDRWIDLVLMQKRL
jgi:L-amino acid N-acyltransferase